MKQVTHNPTEYPKCYEEITTKYEQYYRRTNENYAGHKRMEHDSTTHCKAKGVPAILRS
jgi:hypothetical protein